MNPDREAEILIFNTALALNPGEARSRYLDEACAGDPERRRRIEALIQAYEASPDFLDTNPPTGNVTSPDVHPITEDVGSMIGRYKLLQKIGEGGFGVVYMAEQREPVKRRVALKIIKLGMDTKQVVARFEAERQALALMDHPNIAKVLDGGSTETGRPYFVMELVHGVPVTQFCDEHQLTTKARLELFIQVCQALQHAHHKGIIHRDIKPTNILVTVHDDNPVPKVIDFGIAKATQQELTEKTLFTQFRQFIGTPAYMSPEQAQWTDLDIDTRSDVYSLGVLLYELLTGRTPIDTRELLNAGYDEMCRRIREQEPPLPSTRISTMADAERGTIAKQRQADPRKLGTLLRGDLDWIVMKALEKDRARRYETANDFARDIQRFLSSEPVTAAPPSTVYRLRRFSRRHKAAMAVAAIIVGLLISGTAVSSWLAVRAMDARAEAETETERARRARVAEAEQRALAEKSEAAAKELLVEARHEQGKALIASAQRLKEQKYLFAAKMTAARALGFEGLGRPTNDLAFETNFPKLLKPGSPEEAEARLFIDREPDFAPLWRSSLGRHHPNPVGSFYGRIGHTALWQMAFTTNGTGLLSKIVSGIRYWDVGDGRLLNEFTDDSYAAISPNGDFLVSNDARYFSLRDPGSGQQLCRLEGGAGFIQRIAADHNSRVLAIGLGTFRHPRTGEFSGSNEIKLLNTRTGALISTITNLTKAADALALDPAAQWLAVSASNSVIQIHEVSTGRVIRQLEGHQGAVRTLAFAPAGGLLASGGDDQKIRLWSTDTWSAQTTLEGHTNAVQCLVFHSSKPILISGSADHTLRVWDLERSQLLHTLRGHDNVVHAAAIDATGTRLASGCANGVVLFWDLVTYQSRFLPETHADAISSVRVSPDGSLIASGSYDRTVRLWESHTGKLAATLRGHNAAVHSVDFSPDGSLLASLDARAVVIIWDVARAEHLRTLDPGEPRRDALSWNRGRTLQFHPDGRRIVSRKDRVPIIWDVHSGKRLMDLEPLDGNIMTLTWDPSGSVLAAAAVPDGISMWRLPDSKPYLTVKRGDRMSPSLAFLPNGTRLIRTSDAGFEFWNAGSGKLENTLSSSTALGSMSLMVNPSGNFLVAAGRDNSVHLWDLRGRDEIAKLPGHQRQVTSIDLGPDDSFVVSGSLDGSIILWDLTRDRFEMEWNTMEWKLMSAGEMWLTFDPTGRRLIVTGDQGRLEVRDARTSEQLAGHDIFLPHGDFYWFAAAGSETIFTGSNTGEIRQWNPISGEMMRELKTQKSSVVQLAHQANRALLAALRSDRSLEIWDTRAWTLKRSWNVEVTAGSLEFQPDGTRVAITSRSKSIEFWNVDSGTLDLRTEIDQGQLSGTAFNSSGERMVSGGDEVRIWDLATRRVEFQTASPSEITFTAPTVSPNGLIFAVARFQKEGFLTTVEVRELNTGRVLTEFSIGATMDETPRIAFSPDGNTLAVAWFGTSWGFDTPVRVYDLASALKQSRDLASLAGSFQWTRNPPALDLSLSSTNLFVTTPPMPMRPGPPRRFLDICQNAGQDRQRLLFWRSYWAENWVSARVLVEKLKRAGQDPHEHKALTRMLIKQAREARGKGLTPLAVLHAENAATISADDPEVWAVVAEVALLENRHPRAADASGQLMRVQPQAPRSLRIRGDVFAATEETDRALDAYNSAVNLARGTNEAEWKASLKSRAQLLRRLGRTADARQDQLQGVAIPERDPNLSTNQLDLTFFYNAALDEDLHGIKGNNLKPFVPNRSDPLGGVSFDARGIIHLQTGRPEARDYPKAVTGIPVNRPLTRLHVLHASAFELEELEGIGGEPRVGEYVLNYSDGTRHSFPVELNTHLRDWRYHPDYPDQAEGVKKAGSVWEGRNEHVWHTPLRNVLFKSSWNNPHPEKRVDTIDLISAHESTAPVVLAITVE